MAEPFVQFRIHGSLPDRRRRTWEAKAPTDEGDYDSARLIFPVIMDLWKEKGYPEDFLSISPNENLASRTNGAPQLLTEGLAFLRGIWLVDPYVEYRLIDGYSSRRHTPRGEGSPRLHSAQLRFTAQFREIVELHRVETWEWERISTDATSDAQ
jgi:hypothetical protein